MKRTPIKLDSHTIYLRTIVTVTRQPAIPVRDLGDSGTYFLTFAKELGQQYDVYIDQSIGK